MTAALLLAAAPVWTEVPGASVLEANVEGSIVDWLTTEAADGARAVVLVVQPADGGALQLLRLATDREHPSLAPLGAPPVPADSTVLAARLGPGSATSLLVSRPGAIDRLEESGAPRWDPWIVDPALRTARGVRLDRAQDGTPRVFAAGPGAIFAWKVGPEGPTRLGEAALPVEVRKKNDGLQLVSPFPSIFSGRFVTPPEGMGSERVRAYVASASAWPPTFESCLGRLPSPERVLDRAIVSFDGEPHAVVATIDATKLELFGEKRVRVFPLRAERTRAGIEPRLAADTGMNLWQSASFVARDLDGDGRDDFAIAYWKGLRSAKAAIEVRLATEGGGFGPARRTEVGLDEDQPGWLGFEHDLDGDGVPDLVALAGSRVKIFRGRRTKDGRGIVESKAFVDAPGGSLADRAFTLAVGPSGVEGGNVGTSDGCRVEDVDGDGVPEVVVASGGRMTIVAPNRPR